MANPTCPHCHADLTAKGAVSYLSGDRWETHVEMRGTRRVLVQDEDYECDSSAECTKCWKPIHYDDQDVY